MIGKKGVVSISLTFLIITAFIFIAYSGGFDWFEARFYQDTVIQSFERELQDASRIYLQVRDQIDEELSGIQELESFRNIFQVNQSTAAVQGRLSAIAGINEKFNGLDYVRVYGLSDERLHFSSRDDDIIQRDSTRITYDELFQRDDLLQQYRRVEQNRSTFSYIDNQSNRIVFVIPQYDNLGLLRGNAVWTFSPELFQRYLRDFGLLQLREFPEYIDSETILLNSSNERASLVAALRDYSGSEIDQIKNEATGNILAVISYEVGGSRFLLLRDWDSLFLNDAMRLLLASSLSVTLFLFVFFMLNIRRDPVITVRDRMKRLQIEVLHQYIDAKNDVSPQLIERELHRFRSTMRNRLTAGLGKLPEDIENHIDTMISEGWNEIHSMVSGKSGGSSIDLSRLESTVEQVLIRFQEMQSHPDIQKKAAVSKKSVGTDSLEKSSVPAVNDFEELEEVEALEEVEELEEVEALEEVEELEEVEALEEVEELEEVEALEEVEELEEVEALEEVEELEEVEALEEVEELEEVEALEKVEELEEVEALEEVEELEEIEALEEVEELEEVETLAVRELDGVSNLDSVSESVFSSISIDEPDDFLPQLEGDLDVEVEEISTLETVDNAAFFDLVPAGEDSASTEKSAKSEQAESLPDEYAGGYLLQVEPAYDYTVLSIQTSSIHDHEGIVSIDPHLYDLPAPTDLSDAALLITEVLQSNEPDLSIQPDSAFSRNSAQRQLAIWQSLESGNLNMELFFSQGNYNEVELFKTLMVMSRVIDCSVIIAFKDRGDRLHAVGGLGVPETSVNGLHIPYISLPEDVLIAFEERHPLLLFNIEDIHEVFQFNAEVGKFPGLRKILSIPAEFGNETWFFMFGSSSDSWEPGAGLQEKGIELIPFSSTAISSVDIAR
ncbi:hypothetical protein [Spirochaeta dissipatitropha]